MSSMSHQSGYEVLFSIFSFSFTKSNVTLLSLTTDNDVMFRSKYSWRRHLDQIGFHSCRYSYIKEKRKNNACELNVSQPRQPAVLYSTNPIFAE